RRSREARLAVPEAEREAPERMPEPGRIARLMPPGAAAEMTGKESQEAQEMERPAERPTMPKAERKSL
ncbi:MAG: hypothetical protein K2N94_00635, partial [Lachnospiraceae bacterium]|nr:hypothetical protein [Lachnospiraceae bacterium]